jgi:hypothetical protein
MSLNFPAEVDGEFSDCEVIGLHLFSSNLWVELKELLI